jgi:hypothetical protein
MDTSADKCTSNGNQPGLFSEVTHFVLGIFSRLIGTFALTEADRVKAGIHIRRQGV